MASVGTTVPKVHCGLLDEYLIARVPHYCMYWVHQLFRI